MKWVRAARRANLNDWTAYVDGEAVGRCYEFAHGPQRGRWYWTVTADIKRSVSNRPNTQGQADSGPLAAAAIERCYAELLRRYQPA